MNEKTLTNCAVTKINAAANRFMESLPNCDKVAYGGMINDIILELIKFENYVDPTVPGITISTMHDFVHKFFSDRFNLTDEEDQSMYTKILSRALEIDRLIKLYHLSTE